MNQLYQLIYVSSSIGLLSEPELNKLLVSFRTNNQRHNITGMLLYNSGNIMQVIEGDQGDIEQLFNNIHSDTRHTGIIVLSKKAIIEREFGDWSMSYQNLTGSNTEGFSNFLKVGEFPNDGTVDAGHAKRFLLSFRDTNIAAN